MENRFSVDPVNIMPGLQMLGESIQEKKATRGAFEVERTKEKKLAKLREEAVQVMKTGTPEEIQDFRIRHPEVNKAIEGAYKFKNEQTKTNKLESLRRIVIGGEDPVQVEMERADMVGEAGGDYQQTIDNTYGAMSDPKGAYDRALREYSMLASKDEWKQFQESRGGVVEETKVGAQEILEDGTIIQSTAKGPVVYNPQGQKVTGQDAADAVKMSRAEKVSNQRKAAGEKKTATLEAEQELKGMVEAGVISQKAAANVSVKAFDRLEAINRNISNLDEGIRLLNEEGANTGVIDKYLPSLKKASIKMDNLQGRLGLDVLNTTTFGALSAGELKFALDTAIPKGLQPKDLAIWLEEKKAAQEKLADYIESAAIYLGTPGNTVSGWVKEKRSKRQGKASPQAAPEGAGGQTLNFDAQGNLIQ